MGSYMPQAPMLPPEIRDQQGGAPQGGPEQPPVISQVGQAMNQQQGQPGGDPVALLEQKIQELEKWAGDTMLLVEQVHKPASALLVPIAKAGLALKQEIQKIKQRKTAGSPQPGQAPGGPPGMGAPPQAANPAEGAPAQMAA